MLDFCHNWRCPTAPPAGDIVPDTFVSLDIPVPPNAAATFGYPGSARHVAFYWEPIGDELCYDDGRVAGTGEWHPFLQYRSHRFVAPSLHSWNIGYSDEEADHWLVLDAEAGRTWIAAIGDASAFLREQHPSLESVRMVDLPRIREEIRMAVRQREPTIRLVRALQRQQQEQLDALLSHCDAWLHA